MSFFKPKKLSGKRAGDDNYVAILAGGIGTRFWPQSTLSTPKQFLDILQQGETLLQATYRRFSKIVPPENIYIITGAEYVSLVKEQIKDIQPHQVIGEPARRNTAPCVAYMAHKLYALNPNANFVVAPADHHIEDDVLFKHIILQAFEYASKEDVLITLGIKPTRAHTGYGYIQYNDEKMHGNCAYKVTTFTEKPTLEIAKTFIGSGDFLWNAGIFIWTAQNIIRAFEQHASYINEYFKTGKPYYNTPQEENFITNAYSYTSSKSIDYAIMELAKNTYVIPASFGWSDLGTWPSLWERAKKDYQENAILAKNILLYDTNNCLISAPDKKMIVVQGLEEMCIIDTENALLICHIENEQRMREIHNDVAKWNEGQYL